MRALLTLLLALCAPAWAAAQETVDSPEADETFLTIYPDDLAMVTEVRRINVPEGRSTIRFLGVSDQIIAQTAVLQYFSGVSLESNFDTDLISKGALLNKAVGQRIGLRRINPKTGDSIFVEGILRSASNVNSVIQGAVIETDDGIEALECAGLSESIIFSNMPKDLNPKPVLSMVVEADEAGEKEISLSYLTSGIGWKADYRLDVQDEAGEGKLFGWLTITNSTAKSFKDVPTSIIAGQLNRDYRTRADRPRIKRYVPSCWQQGSTGTGSSNDIVLYKSLGLGDKFDEIVVTGSRLRRNEIAKFSAAAPIADAELAEADVATQEDFGDYKLYRTPRPITVAAQQTKQIAFLNVKDAEYKRVYKYDISPYSLRGFSQKPQSMRVEYEIDNSKDGNLGMPLPEGTMRVMTERANGQTAYLGESFVRDLAVDLPVELHVSYSTGVMIHPGYQTLGKGDDLRFQINAKVLNATGKRIFAEIKINTNEIRYPDLSDESHPRKPKKIVPHYLLEVEPEAIESFHIDMPISQNAAFIHEYTNYLRNDDKKKYSERLQVKTISIGEQPGNLRWLKELVQTPAISELWINGEILSDEKVKDGRNSIREISEKFTLTNSEDYPVLVNFGMRPNNRLDYISSSLEPTDKDRLVWIIKLPANDTVEFTVTTRGDARG